jgi:hypothetical protein
MAMALIDSDINAAIEFHRQQAKTVDHSPLSQPAGTVWRTLK